MKKLLNHLRSMRFGIVLLILIAALSVVGSVIPQERTADWYAEVYPKLKTCPVTGMDINFADISLEQEAIKAVQNEYKPQVNAGSGGADIVDALYQEFIDKMYAAGLDKVKAELQSQIDAYVGK